VLALNNKIVDEESNGAVRTVHLGLDGVQFCAVI
jgi:hypothetical protein